MFIALDKAKETASAGATCRFLLYQAALSVFIWHCLLNQSISLSKLVKEEKLCVIIKFF